MLPEQMSSGLKLGHIQNSRQIAWPLNNCLKSQAIPCLSLTIDNYGLSALLAAVCRIFILRFSFAHGISQFSEHSKLFIDSDHRCLLICFLA